MTNGERASADLLRCAPDEFVAALSVRNYAELEHLHGELMQRNRKKRAALVRHYTAVKRDFEGL